MEYDRLAAAERKCQDQIDELGRYRKGEKKMSLRKAGQLMRDGHKLLRMSRRETGLYRATKLEQLTLLQARLEKTIELWRKGIGVDQRDVNRLSCR